mmetsp:Transcript_19435/g.41012  ORF Transcript_19435/g.41012 Transcript_19435/m.41012 type:complete len:98 (-) Transcript_19435:649-942(-)
MAGRSAILFIAACSDDSGDSVSGRNTIAKMKPPTKMSNDKTETPKWLKQTAKIGDRANPIEKPAIRTPKEGARHKGGMTSDNAERATAIQLTNPERP